MEEPKYTCPLIDNTIAEYEDLEESVSSWVEAHTRSLEEIREANSELRDWGQHHEARAGDLERQVESLEELLQTREEEIANLQAEVLALSAGEGGKRDYYSKDWRDEMIQDQGCTKEPTND